MFNSKYSKVLTIFLIIAIIAIVGLLIYVGIDWYKTYTSETDIDDIMNQFNEYIENEGNSSTNNTEIVNNEVMEPNIDVSNNEVDTSQGNNGNSSSSSTLTYKGFKVVGRIQIPKTNVNYPVLEKVTPQSIQVAVGVMYGPGINEVGNTVISGHNFRNGTFFSNNKKLSEGDKIYLTDMKGNKVTYKITKKYIASANEFDYAMRDTNGKRGITLSTCTDDSTQRIIIWADEE